MSFPLGIQLTIMAGPQALPTPIGPGLADLLIEAEVNEVADGQSTFRLTFGAQRTAAGRGPEVALLADGRFSPGSRLLVIALQAALPTTLMDGLITDIWLDPGRNPAASRIVVSGADLSVAMDLTEEVAGYPEMSEPMIVTAIVERYARFAIVPEPVPPLAAELPALTTRTPMQHETDLAYLYRMADRFGYVFTVRPGAVPLTNTAYWGPPRRVGLPAPALSVGNATLGNVEQLTFAQDGRAAFRVAGLIPGTVKDTPALPVAALAPTLLPPLALRSPYPAGSLLGTRLTAGSDGFSEVRAQGVAQGRVNIASTKVARAEGRLDVTRYGGILRAGGLVGVRGAGTSFDGNWSVQSVSHRLRRREFKQLFTLGRDGTGPIAPVVVP